MVMDWFGYELDFPGIAWVGPVLGTVVFLYGGWPFLTGGVASSATRQPGMMLLIALAITVAFAASWPPSSAASTSTSGGSWRCWSPSCCSATGRRCAPSARPRARWTPWRRCCPTRPSASTADGDVETVAVAELRPGDSCWSAPAAGCRPTARSSTGTAELDESMITGESRAGRQERRATAWWPAPSRPTPRCGSRVDAVGEDTALAGIQRLVAEAQASALPRPGAGRPGRRAACSTSPPAPASSRSSSGPLLGEPDDAVDPHRDRAGDRLPPRPRPGHPAGHRDLDRRSPPAAGILIKDRLALERMRTVDAVLFDKTGTLTRGEPARRPASPPRPARRDDEVAAAWPAAVEADTEHPLARAIVAAARERGRDARRRTDFRSLTGRGVRATVDGRRVAVGGPALLRERGLAGAGGSGRHDRRTGRSAARRCCTCRGDGRSSARSALEDEIRPEAAAGRRRAARRAASGRDDHRRRPAGGRGRGRRPGHRRGLRRGAARGQGRARWPSSRPAG